MTVRRAWGMDDSNALHSYSLVFIPFYSRTCSRVSFYSSCTISFGFVFTSSAFIVCCFVQLNLLNSVNECRELGPITFNCNQKYCFRAISGDTSKKRATFESEVAHLGGWGGEEVLLQITLLMNAIQYAIRNSQHSNQSVWPPNSNWRQWQLYNSRRQRQHSHTKRKRTKNKVKAENLFASEVIKTFVSVVSMPSLRCLNASE